MTDDEALVHAALGSPDDRTPRLVLADWLDEHAGCEQAEVIRSRCSLDSLPAGHPDRPVLIRRERELCDRHASDWVEQCGLPLTWQQALALFRRRLAETAAWCGRGQGALRTPALVPRSIIWHGGQSPPSRSRTNAERQALVNRLGNERARLLVEHGAAPGVAGDGRLLGFYPDATLSEGVSEAESGGFFDVDNVPAWDTWVWVSSDIGPAGSYLVCWVPPSWLLRAEAGIRVNAEDCLRWATDMDTALTRRLRDAGLLW